MDSQPGNKTNKSTIKLKISLEEKPDFKGSVSAFLFDSVGNLLETVRVTEGRASFSSTEDELRRGRLFIAPTLDQADQIEQKPTINMMERMEAYEPALRRRGKLVDVIRIPGSIIDMWPICLCWVRGHVVKAESGLPICNAKVHICEVDRVWRWILRLPDLEILRFRDDFLTVFDKPPQELSIKPKPNLPSFAAMRGGLVNLGIAALNPQPEPPVKYLTFSKTLSAPIAQVSSATPQPEPATELRRMDLPIEIHAAITSTSASIVRRAMVDNIHLIIPYLCFLKPWWWKYWRYYCDETYVVETDALGRFTLIIPYLCKGDKPDLYFWVEYEIDGVLQTVYRPPLWCHTYWNYTCGGDITIYISDDRVPACNNGPDLPGCVVQILSIGRNISMSEIHGPGAASADEGLTTSGEPFGGKLEPRVWFSRTTLRDARHIKYYRWSYRRLTKGDGTPLGVPGPWIPLRRTVVRHYAVPVPGGIAHVPMIMGSQTVGSEGNLFEIRPLAVPAGGIEWTVVDEREDLASAHFETDKLGEGTDACSKAFDSAGKYELKLELFKDTGALVDWTAEGIDLQITNVPAPFGTNTVTSVSASNNYRITDVTGHTIAFRIVLRIDNNCCRAEVKPVGGVGLNITPCGFIEFGPGARVNLRFKAYHPNNFANFEFSVKRGVSSNVDEASAAGQVGSSPVPTNRPIPNPLAPSLAYTLTVPNTGEYQETFEVGYVLGPCTRAAFSEALHVHTWATDGYGRLWYLDAFDHDGFALISLP
jgi:hypothetical protein